MAKMKKGGIIAIVVIVLIIVILGGCVVSGYNSLVQGEEGVDNAWSDVGVQLQRRSDLIPNLVTTVKGYASHEKETFQAVIEARAKASSVNLTSDALNDPQAMANFQKAQDSLSGALSRLMVVAERYPDLKANENFKDLQHQLEGTENRITVARKDYNARVKSFNTKLRVVPTNFINNMFLKLEKKEYFEVTEKAKEVPIVEF